MALKNYTTKINPNESLGDIMGALAKAGARKVMVDYDDHGMADGVTFGLNTGVGPRGFRLPVNSEGVAAVFRREKINAAADQARRTAWRNVRDWVLAQLAIIEAGMVQPDEVFFPYLTNVDGKTLYQTYASGNLLIGDGQEDDYKNGTV